jgi:hypothetical protein
MDYNQGKVDDMVLALLHLTTFKDESGSRAWKGQDWEVMNRLHEKGLIDNPKNKARSVEVTEKGRQMSEDLFRKYFARA